MQIPLLLQTLKQCLKSQGKTYADVADELSLSEASVKRMFSEQHFSLQRLERICHMLDMELSELFQKMEISQSCVERLTHNQEAEIVQDISLILVTVCVFNHWTLEDITEYFILSEQDCISQLLKLDRIGVIELMPGNRVKLLISPNFSWIENGPFECFFRDHVGQEFFNGHFHGEHQFLRVLNATVSKASAAEFQRKLSRLVSEFREISKENSILPIDEREGVTMVLAMRNWDYGLFHHMVRR